MILPASAGQSFSREARKADTLTHTGLARLAGRLLHHTLLSTLNASAVRTCLGELFSQMKRLRSRRETERLAMESCHPIDVGRMERDMMYAFDRHAFFSCAKPSTPASSNRVIYSAESRRLVDRISPPSWSRLVALAIGAVTPGRAIN